MKSNFKFDKQTGTIIPSSDAVAQALNENVQNDVVQTKSNDATIKPSFQDERQINVKSETVNLQQTQIVKMKRVDKATPVQLVDSNGMPEAYLDSDTMGIMMFRERQDYDICQISDEKTGKVLAYIGGYALQFNFNMVELRTMERIEQCLQGLVKLFRHKLMTQNLGHNIDNASS